MTNTKNAYFSNQVDNLSPSQKGTHYLNLASLAMGFSAGYAHGKGVSLGAGDYLLTAGPVALSAAFAVPDTREEKKNMMQLYVTCSNDLENKNIQVKTEKGIEVDYKDLPIETQEKVVDGIEQNLSDLEDRIDNTKYTTNSSTSAGKTAGYTAVGYVAGQLMGRLL